MSTPIEVNSVYVNDVNAPYGAMIQVVEKIAGHTYNLGPIDPDSTAWYSLNQLGFDSGLEFTVVIQPNGGPAAHDLTVITYDVKAPTAAAAGYSGTGEITDPVFKCEGIVYPKGQPSPPCPANTAKSVYVNDVDAPYGATIQVVDKASGTYYRLGDVDPDGNAWYLLKKLGFNSGQQFTVVIQPHGGSAVHDLTVITHEENAPNASAAGYAGSGSLSNATLKYIGIVNPPGQPQ